MSDKTHTTRVVGHSVSKLDALALACGAPVFTDDEQPRHMLHGVFLYSPHAHARIKSIDVSEALAIEGVRAVLHHGNVPRVLHTTAGQGSPEPSPLDTAMFDSTAGLPGPVIMKRFGKAAVVSPK